jgi:hypothetical protein
MESIDIHEIDSCRLTEACARIEKKVELRRTRELKFRFTRLLAWKCCAEVGESEDLLRPL